MADKITTPARLPVKPPALDAPAKAPPKSPRERYQSLGQARLNRWVRSMKVLARLGNRKQYELTDEERAAAVALVGDECAALIRALKGEPDRADVFSFSAYVKARANGGA